MPIYTYKCPQCGEFDRFLKLEKHANVIECPVCARLSTQVITAPLIVQVRPDCHYQSPIDGRPITSHRDRVEDMARNGCIEYDPEMRKDADRRLKEAEIALDRDIDTSVEREISNMSGAEVEMLGKALATSDLDTTRL
jgi:putative FmdB family regulatory protein